MPKMKTHRGAAKRFKVSGTGKVIKYNAFKNHILGKKSSKRKRHMRGSEPVAAGDQRRLKSMLPYGG